MLEALLEWGMDPNAADEVSACGVACRQRGMRRRRVAVVLEQRKATLWDAGSSLCSRRRLTCRCGRMCGVVAGRVRLLRCEEL